MPNGVDPERFYPRPKNPELLDKLGIPKDRFIIGFSGVLRAWHGLDLLLEAVAKMVMKGSKVVLLIVGDGPYREALESIVSGYRLENFVRITGRIRFERIPEYISLFDAAVSPKATFYASPMKVIEYMALAKPVAVPRAPNFLDIIDEGLNGIAFEDGNPLALEEAICLLSESPDYCQKLGFEARKKVEKRLNWRWNAEEVCRLIAALNAHEK
jgi:glycosyltransferase involved in cell wall biosynthesis